MKCNRCGTEFEGKFCPECGAGVEASAAPPTQQPARQPGNRQPAPAAAIKAAKKKKPFFLRWWFILLIIIVVGIIAILARGGGDDGEKIEWPDLILGDQLPEPPVKKGKIYDNTAENLWIDINELSDKLYADYVEACKGKGFTIDEKADSATYGAYNPEGYKLSLMHLGGNSGMTVRLEAPMEMAAIKWPASAAGNQLPVPKSTTGKFSSEHDDNFFVYIGDTTKADYEEYVNACSEKGFRVDYEKGDDYYYADNSEGWHLALRYEGNNIMSIDIDAPSEDSSASTPPTEETEPDTATEPEGNEPEEATDPEEEEPEEPEEPTGDAGNDGLDPDFKAAMDSYEAFMDEYIAFMEKYEESDGTDLEILADYSRYMSKYAEVCDNFAKWEDEEMNAAEAAYYFEVQTRVNEKLFGAIQ